MTVFSTIISDDQVEEAVLETIRKWLPTYMSEVERQRGLDPPYYQRPQSGSYYVRTDFDKWPEEMLPAVIIIAPGIEDDPTRSGAGIYRGKFGIAVTSVVSSNNQEETRRYAMRMGAAIRAAILQHQSLDQAMDGQVRGVDFVGSRNNELPPEDERTIWAYRQLFAVEVDSIVTRPAGPHTPEPPDDPNVPVPDWPTVEPGKTEVTLAKEALLQP